MSKIKSQHTYVLIIFVSVAIIIYLICFFETTDIFHGQFQEEKMDFRLFNSKPHYILFLPIIKIEEIIKTEEKNNYFFYGHIKSGASLPPPRNDKNK